MSEVALDRMLSGCADLGAIYAIRVTKLGRVSAFSALAAHLQAALVVALSYTRRLASSLG